jgi:hypothetical protein
MGTDACRAEKCRCEVDGDALPFEVAGDQKAVRMVRRKRHLQHSPRHHAAEVAADALRRLASAPSCMWSGKLTCHVRPAAKARATSLPMRPQAMV